LRIKRTIRPKYARPEGVEDEPTLIIAPLTARPIEKGIPEPGLLAHIFVAKFVDQQPFYRQIKGFASDYNWKAGLSTFSDWLAAGKWIGRCSSSDAYQSPALRQKPPATPAALPRRRPRGDRQQLN